MFDFTIFRIPVRVQPWFWLSMGLFGFMISQHSSSQQEMILKLLLFMVIAFFSILLHELGHALTGRWLTKAEPMIELVAFGGFARFASYARFSKKAHITMVFAGPLMNLVIAGLLFLSLVAVIQFTPERVDTLFTWFLEMGIRVNILWFIFNMIPVYPMDGGQIIHSLIKSPTTAHSVSLCMAISMIVLGLVLGEFIIVIFFALMAFQNFEMLQHYKR